MWLEIIFQHIAKRRSISMIHIQSYAFVEWYELSTS